MRAESGRGGLVLERDRELERVTGCLQRARQGHGGALAVEGPAGIGKTVLLAAARDMAHDEGFRVLRARGAELEREFAFGVVRQLVEPVVARASFEERAGLLDGPPGVAARLLGLPGIDDGVETETPVAPDPSFEVLHGLYWLCANLASVRPLALMVDDAHWVDGASLRFLSFLLSRVDELRIALLLGARPAEAGENRELLASLMIDPATDVVTVRPLTASGVATLLTAGLDVEPEPEFTAACLEATGGVPFLVRTLVEELREEQIAAVAASAGEVQHVAGMTLSRWTALRLAHLGRDATHLARAVAVLEHAELDQAARLAGLGLADAATASDLLVRADVLNEAPLSFTHPLLRGAVYQAMTVGERVEAHGCAARLLSGAHAAPARVAEHLLVTVPRADRWTVEQLHAAAREAAAKGAPEAAVAYLIRARAEPPPPETGSTLSLELGLVEFRAGEPGWQDQLEEAVASAGDDTALLAATLLFANALCWHERTAEASEVCDRVAARLDGRNAEALLTLEAMAVVYGVLDARTAPLVADRAAALLARATAGSLPRQCLAAAAYLAALANRPANDVADLALEGIAAATGPLPEPVSRAWLPDGGFRHPSALVTLMWAERYDAAQALADAAVAEAEASANGMILPAVLAQRARLAFRRGDLRAAEADARVLLGNSRPPAPQLLRNLGTNVVVDVLVERGDLDEAERTLDSVATNPAGAAVTTHVLGYARGRLRFAQGRFDEAFSDFRAAGEFATSRLAPSPTYLAWRSEAALAALALGDTDTARRLSDEELDLAHAFGAPRTLGVALRASGLVAGGQRGEELVRAAIEVLDGRDTRLEQARALTDLGGLLRRGNRRFEARQPLRQALDVAHHVGAAALAKRAESELRATGAKPRRVQLRGLEALTASERRIAELAAEGLTNREIAQTLFITSRTVEGHLTNVFNKLDIKTRTRLPTALGSPTQAVRA